MRAMARTLWSIALVSGIAAVVAAPQSGAADGAHDVEIRANVFSPRELTVEVGEEVTWTNKDDGYVHSVTADDGSFDSNPQCSDANPGACLDSREQFTHLFTLEGRFPYHSRTTGGPGGQGTSGVVVAVAAGTPAPTACPTSTTATTAPGASTTSTTAC